MICFKYVKFMFSLKCVKFVPSKILVSSNETCIVPDSLCSLGGHDNHLIILGIHLKFKIKNKLKLSCTLVVAY